MTPEEKARQEIDGQLTAAGWVVQDYRELNLTAARGIAVREVLLRSGLCDYLLVADRRPLGVVDAKKTGTTLLTVAERSAPLRTLPARLSYCPFHRFAPLSLREPSK